MRNREREWMMMDTLERGELGFIQMERKTKGSSGEAERDGDKQRERDQ